MTAKAPHVPDFRKMTARLRAAPAVALTVVRKFADRERLIFQNRIENGEFPSFDATPLSDAYLAFKVAHGLDPRTMIATKHYADKIRVFVEPRPGGHTVHVGFDAHDRAADPKTREPTPLPLHVLAAVQEFGSAKANVPPRPHWAPQLREIAKRAGAARVRVVKAVMAGGA